MIKSSNFISTEEVSWAVGIFLSVCAFFKMIFHIGQNLKSDFNNKIKEVADKNDKISDKADMLEKKIITCEGYYELLNNKIENLTERLDRSETNVIQAVASSNEDIKNFFINVRK